jgi:hypothetical protein
MVIEYPQPEPFRAGQRWSEDDDAILIVQLGDNLPIDNIATEHGRTVGSITQRIKHLYTSGAISIVPSLDGGEE